MAEYSDESLGVRMVLPDKISVRQQLRHRSSVVTSYMRGDGADHFEHYWAGVRGLAEEWECDILPLDADLDEVSDPRAADVIVWAGNIFAGHISRLEEDTLPKNS